MNKDRDDRGIDDIEDDLGGDMLMPDHDTEDAGPTKTSMWEDEEVKEDVYDRRDGESVKEIFSLSIPNNEYLENGQANVGYRKLCLSKDYTQIPPTTEIPCVVLRRIRPNIESVPYNESRGLPRWERTVGYSLDGIKPTPNKDGEYMPSCIDPFTNLPYSQCSQPTEFKNRERMIKPLLDVETEITRKDFKYLPKDCSISCRGECPRARWANTMTAEDRKKYGIRSAEAKPICDEHIILYCWHLLRELLFVAYFKRASLAKADSFLRSFKIGGGPSGSKGKPLYRYKSIITIEPVSTYVIPVITNTGIESNYAQIKPVVEWFAEREKDFVRNQAIALQDLKEEAEKETEFNEPEKEKA